MSEGKRHLLSRFKQRAACGLMRPQKWTEKPAEVTCGGCRRSLIMADTEVSQLNSSLVNRKASR